MLEIENRVETRRFGAASWLNAQPNQRLRIADRLRTGFKSRATLQLSNRGLLRIGPLTTLEIQPPETSDAGTSMLNLEKGAAYFFNRDSPSETQFRMPEASAAIRGTEFNIEVDDDGRTVITMLDGEVELTNTAGSVNLVSGEQGIAEPGRPPRKTAVINAINIVQWSLYYPGVLDPSDLGLSVRTHPSLAESLGAYRQGNLLQALALFPTNRTNFSSAEMVYSAALDLSVGEVVSSEDKLTHQAGSDHAKVSDALRELIAAVKFQPWTRHAPPSTATEWMAESYYEQSRSRLNEALDAARQATRVAPEFGFAWARVAELEFSFARIPQAKQALERALNLAPQNTAALALKGFLLLSDGKTAEAIRWFDQAIAADGGFGNAWLGRGLARIRIGESEAGRTDLQTAAVLEPNRAIVRSYLAKSFQNEGDRDRARKEIDYARKLDPNDPTAWLYSALAHWEENRINTALRDLQKSQDLNDNRSVFRSQLLLDRDRAVRGANLAAVYRDAGMPEVSLREAARVVGADFANYSGHLFLASSYAQQAGALGNNLRYETATLNELLLANLLAPPEAGLLSQSVSQQEYSRLLERDRLGFYSGTEYTSQGSWRQAVSQFGLFGGSSYALDYFHDSIKGQQPNGGVQRHNVSAAIKQRFTPQDDLFIQTVYSSTRAGDLTQYFDPQQAQTDRQSRERQEPTVLMGYHRQWSPGNHTLFLAGRITDTLEYSDASYQEQLLLKDSTGTVIGLPKAGSAREQPFPVPQAPLELESTAEIYTVELEHIWQGDRQNAVVGSRYQTGTFDGRTSLGASSRTRMGDESGYIPNIPFPVYFSNPATAQDFHLDMERFSTYGYVDWRLLDPLTLTSGLSYDHLQYPDNHLAPPLSAEHGSNDQLSPKLGLTVIPWRNATIRAAWTRSLGGVSFDQSVRLEPSQVSGFNQSFRSIIPESVAGSAANAGFETRSFNLDHRFPTETYVGLGGEWLLSDVTRELGVFETVTGQPRVSSISQDLDFEERTLLATIHQLLGDYWSAGVVYRLSRADLTSRFPDIPASVSSAARSEQDATLHQTRFLLALNTPTGFFAQADSVWFQQSNSGQNSAAIASENFWQHNLVLGYRLPRRKAELRIGLLNLADQDFRLNPLNLHADLPRERMLALNLRMNF
ncbi:MAG: FecR domain-containing protein [Verrucomicrobia bacterium]|nr:FecR domain-containing protein [Verrucomicrobiota bacterium]